MVERITCMVLVLAGFLLAAASPVTADDNTPIPPTKAALQGWFQSNVKGLEARKATLDPELVAAETGNPRIIKVMKDGSGDFKTITDAISSIPSGNSKRVIVYIGGGVYHEKIRIERTKSFITLYGAPNNMPNLTFTGTAAKYGTVDSASLIVESNYFMAVNLIIANSSPRPDGKAAGAQAVALRISGDKAAFYNCKLIGFQDTLCDDRGNHFFKDCYIEGTVDFIFGSGTSLYVNTQLNVLGDAGLTVITAQARESNSETTGYVFVHSQVTGTGTGSYLGRAWKTNPRVVFAYTTMTGVVHPEGWSVNFHPERSGTVYYGEYKCSGPGAAPAKRAKYVKQLSDAEARPFLTLGFIHGSKWLLPPPHPKV
ncbi:hypothetical protein FNV43_RR24317 [Rhamnella rubrinervis]|uniref:Pectinesterase n=1 Tax=Rhamnella rubrinervis TaxID=2594499 RepID=A0A8K0DST7_9ROSA|nr:hypothetical protein FNV43_RR24317 [Rhamnella rubrinervis]